jgi:hypothetical protein
MKTVKFTATHVGAPDGKTVQKFKQGDERELPDKFADSCIRGKVATLVEGEKPEPKPAPGPDPEGYTEPQKKDDDAEPQSDAQSSDDSKGSEDSESSEGSETSSQDQESAKNDDNPDDAEKPVESSDEKGSRTPRRPVEDKAVKGSDEDKKD